MKVLFIAGVSGNSKQRRRVVRLWKKMGYKVEGLYFGDGTFAVGVENVT